MALAGLSKANAAASTAAPRYYRPELDGLRFVAFLGVFVHHAFPQTPEWYAWQGLTPPLPELAAALKKTLHGRSIARVRPPGTVIPGDGRAGRATRQRRSCRTRSTTADGRASESGLRASRRTGGRLATLVTEGRTFPHRATSERIYPHQKSNTARRVRRSIPRDRCRLRDRQ